MKNTLTVKELISKLSEFNPNASVYMCVDGHVTYIEDNCMSWYGGDDISSERNITEEKQKTDQVFIYLENTKNNCDIYKNDRK